MKKILLILLACTALSSVWAQDLSSYYNYMLNKYNINSAYIGAGDSYMGAMNSRAQMTDVEGGPTNLMFALQGPLFKDQGLGLKVISDTRGIFNTTRTDAMYSHNFEVDSNMSFRLGLSAGVISRRITNKNLNTNATLFSEDDPTLSASDFNQTNFVAGFGFMVKWKELEVGFSAPHIVENASLFNQHFVGSLYYSYKPTNSKWNIQPWAMYQALPVSPDLFDVAVKGEWDEKVFVQVGYATNNSIKSAVGLSVKGFGLAYMYEHSTGNVKNLSASTHELMLTVSIKKKKKVTLEIEEDESVETRLNNMIEYMSSLMEDETKYEKAFIQEEIKKIQRELNTILQENNEENAEDVAEKLGKIEEQIDFLIEKYNVQD